MCTYQTELFEIAGSGKGPAQWMRFTDATVYVDHPVHAMAGHTLNIDLRRPLTGRRHGSRWSCTRRPLGSLPRRSCARSMPSRRPFSPLVEPRSQWME